MKLSAFLADSFQPYKGSIKIERKGAIEDYRAKYQRLVGDKPTSLFRHEIYSTTPGDILTVWVKVPSNTVKDFQYDVVLQFIPANNALTYEDCEIKVFSNSPGFVFSYAYTFAHWDPTVSPRDNVPITIRNSLPANRLLIPGLERKLGKMAITKPPYYRNPMGIPQFDESIYFAIFYLMDNVDFADILGCTNKRSFSNLVSLIPSFDHIQAERKRAEVKQKQSKAVNQKSNDELFAEKEKELSVANGTNTTRRPKQPKSMKTTSINKTRSMKTPNKMKSSH